MNSFIRTAVLVPVYNEEEHLAVFLTELKKSGLPVLVVDDGSADASSEIARKCGVQILALGTNKGKGAALRAGFRRLLDDGFDWVIIMDGDGQHLPAEIPRFLEASRAAAKPVIVNGDRLGNTAGRPAVRLWTNRFMSFTVSVLAGRRIRDVQCGYKMLPAEFLKKARFSSDRFEIEDDIVLEAVRLGYPVISVPVTTVYGGEMSHIRPMRDTWRFLCFLGRWARGRWTS